MDNTEKINTNTDDAKIEFQYFLKLSEKLTAFTIFQLEGTGVAETYYQTLRKNVGDTIFQKLLTVFKKISTATYEDTSGFDSAMRHEILSDDILGPVSRNIIKMWFLGIWYQLPDFWLEKYGNNKDTATFVISSSAYREGLLWSAIGAHPMGAKAPGYGTWTDAPRIPDLTPV